MKNKLNLGPLFPYKKELQDLIEQLVNAIAPDLIYLSSIYKEVPALISLHLVIKTPT